MDEIHNTKGFLFLILISTKVDNFQLFVTNLVQDNMS